MLTPGPESGLTLVRIRVQPTFVEATYGTSYGPAHVRLAHPSSTSGRVDARTSRFAVQVRGTHASVRETLLRSIVAGVQAHEHAFAWSIAEDAQRADPYDLEQVALIAGLKPALRTVLDASRAEPLRRFYGAAGFYVASAHAPASIAPSGSVVLYVGRTDDVTRELAEADALSFAASRPDAAHHRRLGSLLGFPPCCVDAFVDRWSRTEGPTATSTRSDELFDLLEHAHTATPIARLNVVPRGVTPVYASFDPCRFDCAAARATADALASVLETDVRRRVDATLARPHAVSARGTRFVLRLAPDLDAIVDARALQRTREAGVSAEAIAEARALVGVRLDARREAVSSDGRVTRVLAFCAR